jgi:diguanylate cyclase (GGDEF)-like protein
MMAGLGDARLATPGPDRLLAVIELQNAIAAAAMSADQVMRVVAERAIAMTKANGVMVGIVESDDIVCRATAGASVPEVGARLPKAWSLAGRCIADRRPVRADNAATDARVDPETRARGAGSMICVPLLYGEHAVGVLELISAKPSAFSDEDLGTLPLLAQIVAIALHRAYTYPRPRLDTAHDPLTGLTNRRAFDERIDAELGRNRRYGHSFSLALLRLVGLETVSDRLGQAAADAYLSEVAAILTQHTRAIDACFRLGANELAIVMPGTSLEGGQVLAERFRAHIAALRPGDTTVTASVGIVEAGAETADELTARANQALG